MSPPEERNRSPEARPPKRSRERLKDRREAAEPEELRRELAAAGAPEQPVEVRRVRPMLARLHAKAFSNPGYLFELKYDGHRLLVGKTGERVELLTRNGREVSRSFPEIVRAVAALPAGDLVLDGELVVLGEDARPDFPALQRRALKTGPRDVERAAVESPASLVAFDLPALEGYDLRPLPLAVRKRFLRRVLPAEGPVAYADHVEERGEELYAEIRRRGLEGMVAKRADSVYHGGRSSAWLKVKIPGGGRRPRVRQTARDKVFWPAEGLTKGDLLDYHRRMASAMLPYLEDRPLVLHRFPHGIDGESFFQKHAPEHLPEWVRTELVASKEGERATRAVVCDDAETLLYLVQLATIPIHLWSSRVADLTRPDWSILDLDAKDAPFLDVVMVARSLREITLEAGLPSFVKTSGATGLHVLIPLAGLLTHEQSRQLAELLARLAVERCPGISSLARMPAARRGKVYVDTLQNGYGKLLVAPWSVRPLPGAPVSTPLDWSEVAPGLDPAAFTLRTAPERFDRLQEDPLGPVLTAVPDLVSVLERLGEIVS